MKLPWQTPTVTPVDSPRRLKVGTRIRLTDGRCGLPVGAEGFVTATYRNGTAWADGWFAVRARFDGGTFDIYRDEFTLASRAEQIEAAKKRHPAGGREAA